MGSCGRPWIQSVLIHCDQQDMTRRETDVPAKVGYLAIDTVDPNSLAPFWCGLLGVEIDTTIGVGDFLILSPTGEGLTVGFQKVPEIKSTQTL